MQTNNKNCELKKHINAIHCTNNLTLIQRKLFNALLYHAYDKLPYQSCFQIQAKVLCRLIGYNSNDYNKLKKALLGLMTVAIEWNVIDIGSDKKREKWQASSILSSAKFESGMCSYEYSTVMKEFLYHPEIYGRIDMNLVAKFKSSYGIALYENCIRYQKITQTPWFTVTTFRQLMGVLGDKYNAFKDFKKRVLSVAVGEVNALSPIHVEPEILRKNQKVISIRFKINKKTLTIARQNTKEETHDKDIIKLLQNTFSLSEHSIDILLAEYSIDYVREKVKMIRGSISFKAGRIKDLSGYLVDALRKDYKLKKSSKEIVDQAERNKVEKIKIIEKQEEVKEGKYRDYVNSIMQTFIKTLSEAEKTKLIDEFVIALKNENAVAYKWYKEKQFRHVAMKPLYHDFIRKYKEKQLGIVLSKEDFFSVLGN